MLDSAEGKPDKQTGESDVEQFATESCKCLEEAHHMLLDTDRRLQAQLQHCNCNKYAVVHTSWTDTNGGRRFAHCPDFECDYFRWVDAPLCTRARIIIPGLTRRIDMLEGEMRTLEAINNKVEKMNTWSLYFLLILTSWIMISCWF
ncbi:hypothetical protein DCAR_0626667 [Daucus carota subsp. sativus]|uniref:GRF-type domain-containing protein n=1 Tax=Daucus carota subsp. sativus TaxID=79200 RepID=A0AAF1B796_DAUCS|nr:PREDICTED: uncharacterized protein LOC108226381 [Daucus carota subsp. sativus]WOH07238.1 hypothetical protein DCAR_0626667 [Daucus carota subsp. sativus]